VQLFGVVDRHLRTKLPQPLLCGLIKALRDVQAVLDTPSYSLSEVSGGMVPSGILEDYMALPKWSAKQLSGGSGGTGGSWCGAVSLGLVADFLVGQRIFLAWAARSRVRRDRHQRAGKRKHD